MLRFGVVILVFNGHFQLFYQKRCNKRYKVHLSIGKAVPRVAMQVDLTRKILGSIFVEFCNFKW